MTLGRATADHGVVDDTTRDPIRRIDGIFERRLLTNTKSRLRSPTSKRGVSQPTSLGPEGSGSSSVGTRFEIGD